MAAKEKSGVIQAPHVGGGISAAALDHAAWDASTPVLIARYWSGHDAPRGRHAEARVIWTNDSLLVRFTCRQEEPLVVSAAPQAARKTIGLWERDVCEIFVTPGDAPIAHYLEFEAAPTGEWLDLAILLGTGKDTRRRETDWQFCSGMTAAARITEGMVTIAMQLPFAAFGHRPAVGDRWRANLFRCVGAGSERGYLAWQPTLTPLPDFHVPELFGILRFTA